MIAQGGCTPMRETLHLLFPSHRKLAQGVPDAVWSGGLMDAPMMIIVVRFGVHVETGTLGLLE